MEPSRLVLINLDLFRVIAQYQCGVYEQVRPFTKKTLWSRVLDLMKYFQSPDTVALRMYELDVNLMKPWLTLYDESYFHRLIEYNPLILDVILYYSAYSGRLNVLKYLSRHYESNKAAPHLLDMAAWQGNMDVFVYLSSMGFSGCTYRAMDLAAASGHLAMVEYLNDNRTEGCSAKAIDAAAAAGAFDVVRYLHFRGKKATTKAVDGAAATGHLEIIKFLLDARTEGFTKKAALSASYHHHDDVVNYLCKYTPCA